MSSRSRKDSFKKGDRVSARWSGSNVFYDAKVLDATSRTYKVQFDDGSVSSVKLSDVKKLAVSKDSSPKTTKTAARSRSRSTGRTSRSRSRSPARREKRTSATKNEKKPVVKEDKKKSEEKSNSNSVSKDEIDGISKSVLTREKIEAFRTGISPMVTLNSYTKEVSITQEKHEAPSVRPRSLRLAARSSEFPKESNATTSSEKAKYSDDEDDEEEEEEELIISSPSISKALKTFYFFATLLKMVLLPVMLLFLVFSCTKKHCTVLDVPPFYARWRDLGNAIKYPIASVFAFHLLQVILSLIPLGRKVTGFSIEANKNPFEYRLNGILILIFNLIVFGVCSYFGLYMNWGFEKFRNIALSTALYSIVCAIVLHIYATVKGGGTTQTKVPFLGNFYNGSFTNPVLFGKVDIKTSFIRAGLIGSVLLNLSIVLKFVLMKSYVTVPMALTSGMQTFFVLDFFLREEKMLSTATYTTDTLGYAFILTTGFLVPIGLALQNVYLFNFEARSSFVPHWCSGAVLCLFFVGYYIYFTSTNIKHNFRRNPFCPSLSEVASIPTSKKRRLIASGWWGRVRHPNYLGLLIMAVAWTLPCGFAHVVPFGPLALLSIALVIRSIRIEAECKEKYGPAWNNYVEKVRSRLIPYIF